jgi:hypothetical protein
MNRILCNATIDGDTVTVVGAGDHSGVTRTYVITGEDETAMAMEGIRRFVEEFDDGVDDLTLA